jgi:hypothetical protein
MLSMDDLVEVKELMPGYVHHWIYTENHRMIFLVARYEQNGQKTYRQFHVEGGELVEGMPVESYPLYGLDSLSQHSPLNAVLITEGEKSAAVLHQLGWPCITTVLGAQNPSKSDWRPLGIFPDLLFCEIMTKQVLTLPA